MTVLIWGSSWLAIRFQLGVVDPTVSIVWRFVLAGGLILGYARLRRLPIITTVAEHAWLAAEGLLLFGANYVTAYLAVRWLPSGLVAVVFSLAVFFNLLGARFFFGTPIQPVTFGGALLGCAGVGLVFAPQFTAVRSTQAAYLGATYALASALISSLGSMVASRNQLRGQPVLQSTGWAMLYGAAFVAIYAGLTGRPFAFDLRLPYISSLLYLAALGSVVAFTAYLTLMKRIGPARAAYCNVAVPIVALLLSTLFEHLRWQALMVLGVALCLAGNVLMLGGGRRGAASPRTASMASRQRAP